LTVGDRALQLHPAMSFIVENELVGMFSQNGFQTIKKGALVDIVFDNAPGASIAPESQPFRTASARGRSPWTQKVQNARKKAHVFRLCCKIPIINLSELVPGFAIMKADRLFPCRMIWAQPIRALMAV
jgi:hypothetical protein